MVPLTARALSVLDGMERIEGNPWVIPAKKGGGRLLNLHHYWQAVRARAGLDDVRIHDLRHSYASRALVLGESLSAIGQLLGHRHVVSTARYTHLMRDAEKIAASRVGESIGVHVGPREG